jgi:transketolase
MEAKIAPQVPTETHSYPEEKTITLDAPTWNKGDSVATRAAYGKALVALGGADDRIVALDCDTKNSTMTIDFLNAHPARFVECYIAEQNMLGAAMGISCRGLIPFTNTFAAFHTRSFDFIRMAGVGKNNIKVVGSHCGVSIGEDGASQMGLEDLAMMRTIPEAIVLYPSDAVSTWWATQIVANYKGMSYIRTSRPNTPVIYENAEAFEAGKCKVVK